MSDAPFRYTVELTHTPNYVDGADHWVAEMGDYLETADSLPRVLWKLARALEACGEGIADPDHPMVFEDVDLDAVLRGNDE